MAVRNDVTVDWSVNPRIITVAAPSTTILIQDLVDTVRDLEDDPYVMSEPHLINAAGKEDLGGGSFVGITVSLRDAELAFEARLGPAFELCTVSGGNLTAVEADGVTPKDPVHPTDYTTVVITQSSSPTIINADASALWNVVLESGLSMGQVMSVLLAAASGKTTLTGDQFAIRNQADDRDRIDATTTTTGERTAVTIDVTDVGPF